MIFRKPGQSLIKGGASAGGMLIKDDGFEGFNAPGSPTKNQEEKKEKKRKLTEFEKESLAVMKKNDDEIDGLLDIAIQKLDILKFHAQDINTAVNT